MPESIEQQQPASVESFGDACRLSQADDAEDSALKFVASSEPPDEAFGRDASLELSAEGESDSEARSVTSDI